MQFVPVGLLPGDPSIGRPADQPAPWTNCRSYPRLEQRQYDLVLLDPPAWAKSAFGTVDLLRDYQSLLKPALLATADNGVLICCNNLAKVSMDDWREQVLRCAEKAGARCVNAQVLPPAE